MLADLESVMDDVSETRISRPRLITNGHHAYAASKSKLRIRLAGAGEASAIAEFTNTTFRGKNHFLPAGFTSARDVEQLIKRGKFLLAENETQIIGCAYLDPRLEASRLELLAVSPPQQQAGIGSQLLETAERLSSSMQCLFMHLRVMNLNWEMIRFCRHRGYVEFGLESLNGGQPASLYCHFVRMCKQLKADFIF
jgi:N-acetylglutamate synthase-like GNAT family acetyltransferase